MVALYIAIGVIVGGGVGMWLTTGVLRNKLLAKSQQVLKDAEEKGEILKKEKELQAKEKFLQLKSEHDKRVNEQNNKLRDTENKLKQRENTLNQKVDELQKKSNELKGVSEKLNSEIETLHKRQAEVEKVYKESVEKLEHIAGMSAEDAKKQLIDSMTEEARAEAEGAAGYLPKDVDQDRLSEAIKIAAAGGAFVREHFQSTPSLLTVREMDVLRLLAQGKQRDQIAAALGIGAESVKTHLKGIMNKLACPNATSAVGRAYELGILRA